MDILSKIPMFRNIETALDVKREVDATDEAEAKAARIKFHRTSVRNGPTNFRSITSGQERRARQRALDAMTRRARRKQIRDHFADQRRASVLLGKLTAVGVVDFSGTHVHDDDKATAATVWLLLHFGKRDEQAEILTGEDDILYAFQSAFNVWQGLVGLPKTKISRASS